MITLDNDNGCCLGLGNDRVNYIERAQVEVVNLIAKTMNVILRLHGVEIIVERKGCLAVQDFAVGSKDERIVRGKDVDENELRAGKSGHFRLEGSEYI